MRKWILGCLGCFTSVVVVGAVCLAALFWLKFGPSMMAADKVFGSWFPNGKLPVGGIKGDQTVVTLLFSSYVEIAQELKVNSEWQAYIDYNNPDKLQTFLKDYFGALHIADITFAEVGSLHLPKGDHPIIHGEDKSDKTPIVLVLLQYPDERMVFLLISGHVDTHQELDEEAQRLIEKTRLKERLIYPVFPKS